jgi:glycosyltransferase involved in cell wall biosynthesis
VPESNRQLRVLHVIPYFHPAYVYGGPIESVYGLCRALARSGCEVRVLTTDTNGPGRLEVPTDRDLALQDGVRVRYCRRDALESVSIQLLRLLPTYIGWADLVHLAPVYSFPTIPTLMLTRVLRKPLVWSPRGALQRWDGTRKPALKAIWEAICRLLVPKQALLHVTSEDERQASFTRMRLRTCVIPNGVDLPCEVLHAPSEGALRLLFIGRLNPQKGIENLLEACALARRTGLALSLQIVGSGEPSYTDQIRNRIDSLQLNDIVKMRGHLTGQDKEDCFESSDVLVLPSFKENFGMAIAEALAHSVPVIAAKGTPWERVEANGCGLWVDNDPQSLAHAIRTISAMPLAEMGQKGREWMEREFSWNAIAQQMIAVYRQLGQRFES